MATEPSMFASVLHGREDIRYESVAKPEPGPHQVLIDVRATGVCGSDIPRVLSDGAHFYPMVLGHEFAGVVAQIGTEVNGWEIGDRVAVAPLVPCLKCDECMVGRYSACPNYSFIGSREFGALAQYVAVSATNLVKLADNLSFEQGAMVEPSTVAIHGLRVGGYRPGGHVAVLGGGTIGAFAAQWARILGAKSVTVIDIDKDRLTLAAQIGANHVIDSATEDVRLRSAEITAQKGFDHVFETAGQNATQALAMQLVAAGGDITLIGNSHRDLAFPASTFELLNRKEVTLTASWMSYSAPFPGPEWTDTVHYMSTGQLRGAPELLHGCFRLDEVADAFQLFKEPGAVKGKLMFVQSPTTKR